MKDISVTLEGEKAVFSWKDGQIYCQGYDLESEKAVLALTSYGKGVGVLLVAINICCKTEAEFMSEVEMFVSGNIKPLYNTYLEGWPEGQLLFEYYSYSSDPFVRWGGILNARLSERHYKRLWADKEDRFKVKMASLTELPEKYFHPLLALPVQWITYALAGNQNCPFDILELLAKDDDVVLRRHVALNPGCPPGILELLSKDNDRDVRRYVAQDPACPEKSLEILSQDKDEDVRLSAQYNLAKSKGLET